MNQHEQDLENAMMDEVTANTDYVHEPVKKEILSFAWAMTLGIAGTVIVSAVIIYLIVEYL